MKSTHLLYCLLTAVPLALGGCSSAGGIAWGEEAGGGARQMAGAGAANGETIRTGSISGPLANAAAAIIGQHEATLRQRQVAAQRGRGWTARHLASQHPAPGQHYIAVDTESDSRTSPQAQKTVMIFDTQAQQVVGKNVYDVQSPPPVGGIARFETYSAQYVGPGL